jgi:hypothetical protein
MAGETPSICVPGAFQCLRIAAAVDERSGVSRWYCDEISPAERWPGRFRGEEAEARLRDLSWLGPRACRHEAVIEEAMRHGPVLPARFATLFASADSLRGFVLRHRSAIAGFFSEIGDQQEWAVKGLLVRARRERYAPRQRGRSSTADDRLPGRAGRAKRIGGGIDRRLRLWLKGPAGAPPRCGCWPGFRERSPGAGAVEGAQAIWT